MSSSRLDRAHTVRASRTPSKRKARSRSDHYTRSQVILARVFVFKPAAGDAPGQFLRFAMVNALAFVQVWAVSVGLARVAFPAAGFTWQAETVAHVAGVLSPVVTSYLLHKHFSFRTA